MTRSDFWRNLRIQFRLLDNKSAVLRGEWHRYEEKKEEWHMLGPLAEEFMDLAKLAGSALNPHEPDSLIVWLSAVKTHAGLADYSRAVEMVLIHGKRMDHEHGTIR